VKFFNFIRNFWKFFSLKHEEFSVLISYISKIKDVNDRVDRLSLTAEMQSNVIAQMAKNQYEMATLQSDLVPGSSVLSEIENSIKTNAKSGNVYIIDKDDDDDIFH
jgi:hypothetical protein